MYFIRALLAASLVLVVKPGSQKTAGKTYDEWNNDTFDQCDPSLPAMTKPRLEVRGRYIVPQRFLEATRAEFFVTASVSRS